MIPGNVQKSFENICSNYGEIARLHLTKPVRNLEFIDIQNLFVDMAVSCNFNIWDQEIMANLLREGVKSKKDYRRLRSLVRLRLLDCLHQIQDLAEDGIRNLGGRI